MKYKKVRALPSFKQKLADEEIKQIDIAEATGLTRECVSKIVNGKSGSLRTVKIICEYLDINQGLHFEVIEMETISVMIKKIKSNSNNFCLSFDDDENMWCLGFSQAMDGLQFFDKDLSKVLRKGLNYINYE